MSAVGVNVAVQVRPLSAEAKAVSVPFSTVTSLLSNASTRSEKVTVTVEVSPIFSAVSLIVTVATTGALVSTA